MILPEQNNIDEEELAKFSKLNEEWWNPTGKMRLLHLSNSMRLKYITQKTNLKDRHTLDLGCGGGLLSEELAKCGAIVTGLDVSESLIATAKSHAERKKLAINYKCQDVEILVKNKQHFDVITCMELLEHVPNPQKIIQACSALLRSNGQLFFSTINRNLKAYLYAIVVAEYFFNLLPKGTHDYTKFIRPSELIKWAKSCSLHLLDIAGIHYHPFKNEFSLSRDVSINYLINFQR